VDKNEDLDQPMKPAYQRESPRAPKPVKSNQAKQRASTARANTRQATTSRPFTRSYAVWAAENTLRPDYHDPSPNAEGEDAMVTRAKKRPIREDAAVPVSPKTSLWSDAARPTKRRRMRRVPTTPPSSSPLSSVPSRSSPVVTSDERRASFHTRDQRRQVNHDVEPSEDNTERGTGEDAGHEQRDQEQEELKPVEPVMEADNFEPSRKVKPIKPRVPAIRIEESEPVEQGKWEDSGGPVKPQQAQIGPNAPERQPSDPQAQHKKTSNNSTNHDGILVSLETPAQAVLTPKTAAQFTIRARTAPSSVFAPLLDGWSPPPTARSAAAKGVLQREHTKYTAPRRVTHISVARLSQATSAPPASSAAGPTGRDATGNDGSAPRPCWWKGSAFAPIPPVSPPRRPPTRRAITSLAAGPSADSSRSSTTAAARLLLTAPTTSLRPSNAHVPDPARRPTAVRKPKVRFAEAPTIRALSPEQPPSFQNYSDLAYVVNKDLEWRKALSADLERQKQVAEQKQPGMWTEAEWDVVEVLATMRAFRDKVGHSPCPHPLSLAVTQQINVESVPHAVERPPPSRSHLQSTSECKL